MVDLAPQEAALMGGGCCQLMKVTNTFIICYCNCNVVYIMNRLSGAHRNRTSTWEVEDPHSSLNTYFCILDCLFVGFFFSFNLF